MKNVSSIPKNGFYDLTVQYSSHYPNRYNVISGVRKFVILNCIHPSGMVYQFHECKARLQKWEKFTNSTKRQYLSELERIWDYGIDNQLINSNRRKRNNGEVKKEALPTTTPPPPIPPSQMQPLEINRRWFESHHNFRLRFKVTFKDGWFTGQCDNNPDIIFHGKTVKELINNLGYLLVELTD